VTKLEKRLRKLEQSPRNISSEELSTILISLGFEYRAGKGSHSFYKHPKLPEFPLTIPEQNPLKQVYIKKVRDLINRLREMENDG